MSCGNNSDEFSPRCFVCNGANEVYYDLANAEIKKREKNPLKMFFDILPINDPKNILSITDKPTRTLHAKKLGKIVGLKNLYLKVEGDNPTGTTKDRMASVALSFFRDIGIKEFAIATTGNTGASYAYGVNKFKGFKLHTFFYGDGHRLCKYENCITRYYKTYQGFDHCSEMAKKYATIHKIFWEGGFFNFSRREGLKLALLEAMITKKMEFDWYFQAISSGMGIVGSMKGAQELKSLGEIDKVPRICCVQEDTCSPMVNAYLDNSEIIGQKYMVKEPTGICQALLRGNPGQTYSLVKKDVVQSKGTFRKVSKEQILEAMGLVQLHEKIEIGQEAGAALSAAIKMRQDGKIDDDANVFINMTSGVLKYRGAPKKAKLVEGL